MSLIESAWVNDLETLKTLIARGTDVNTAIDNGRTALWHAVTNGYIECATALIDAKADVDKASEYGKTPLHQASYNGHVQCIRLLIKHKANVNTLNNSGFSSLHSASMYGTLVCVQTLVAAGAENDRPDSDDWTPLAYAIKSNHPNVAEYLLHSGAKMENVPSAVKAPAWMTDMIAKRCNIMSSTLALKGVLKRRLGLSKDATHLIALYFWRMRLK